MVERAVLSRRLEIEPAFSESLNGPSGESVFGQLDYLPSIVIILTHGSRGPVPYLQDERGGGSVTASDAASELGSLPGRNLLVVLPCCFAGTVSEPFLENDRIGAVFAPLNEEIGDREVASMLRALGDEIRMLDVFSISRGFRMQRRRRKAAPKNVFGSLRLEQDAVETNPLHPSSGLGLGLQKGQWRGAPRPEVVHPRRKTESEEELGFPSRPTFDDVVTLVTEVIGETDEVDSNVTDGYRA